MHVTISLRIKIRSSASFDKKLLDHDGKIFFDEGKTVF